MECYYSWCTDDVEFVNSATIVPFALCPIIGMYAVVFSIGQTKINYASHNFYVFPCFYRRVILLSTFVHKTGKNPHNSNVDRLIAIEL